jgi:hypothetical protein
VILSVTRQFLFIHIPKTAGTSIRQALEPCGVTEYSSYSRGLEEYIMVKNKFPPHLTYAGAAEVLTVDLSRFYKFTFVRNPWDRFVSMYEYYRKDTRHAMHARCQSCSFGDFIHDVVTRRATFDTKNQIDYIVPPARLGAMDFIGKVENIAEDFSIVCRKLGIPDARLPVLNTTEHKPYRSYYTDALKKTVESHCKAEIEAFGYAY